jgi:hypothetical protein
LELIEEFRQTWQRLEEKASGAGGELIVWKSQTRR